MREQNWRDIVKKAKLYIELGQEDHYLYYNHNESKLEDFPWEFVTSYEPGGGHRLEIDTSVRFRAVHPAGLKFSWVFDIEPHNASGKGYYMIDIEGCQKVLSFLNGKPRKEFSAYLKDCAHKVAAKADEWKKLADDQYKAADALIKAGSL